MSRRTAAELEASILAVVAPPGVRSADVATMLRAGLDHIATTMRGMATRGLLVARLETVEEATARVERSPRRALVRRVVRRQLLYTRA